MNLDLIESMMDELAANDYVYMHPCSPSPKAANSKTNRKAPRESSPFF